MADLLLSPAGYNDFDTVTGLPGDPSQVVSGSSVAQALTALGVGWNQVAGNILTRAVAPTVQTAPLTSVSAPAPGVSLPDYTLNFLSIPNIPLPGYGQQEQYQQAAYTIPTGSSGTWYVPGDGFLSWLRDKLGMNVITDNMSNWLKLVFWIFAGLVGIKLINYIRGR